MITCTLPRCKNEFEPRRQKHRFCCAAHRSRFAYLPIKEANEAKRVADLPRKNAEFAARNRYSTLSFDGRYGGSKNPNYLSALMGGKS
jgi:hypothetical protein